MNKRISELDGMITTSIVSGMTLTNNDIKDIRKKLSLQKIEELKKELVKNNQSQDEGFLGNVLGSLMKVGLPLENNVIIHLGKSILLPLGLTAAASAKDGETLKKILGLRTTALIISNEEVKDIVKKVEYLEESVLLTKMLVTLLKVNQKYSKVDSLVYYQVHQLLVYQDICQQVKV